MFIPPKDVIDLTESDIKNEVLSVRGNCYDSCFQNDLPEITLHSVMGFGSRNVEKMKILKLTNGQMEEPCDNCQYPVEIYYLRLLIADRLLL